MSYRRITVDSATWICTGYFGNFNSNMTHRKPVYWISLFVLAIGYFVCPHHGPLSPPSACAHSHNEEAEHTDCGGHDHEGSDCDCLCCEDFVGHPAFESSAWIDSTDSPAPLALANIQLIAQTGVKTSFFLAAEPLDPLIHRGTRVPTLSSLLI